MAFQIDKKSIEEIKKRVKKEIATGMSPKTKKILSIAENEMYLGGFGLSKDELETSIVTRLKLTQSEYEQKVKAPIQEFFKIMEQNKVFCNSLKNACYLLDQLPEASKITKQDLIDLDEKAKREDRGIDNAQLQNVMSKMGVVVNQQRTIFDKMANLPKTQNEGAVIKRLEELVNDYATMFELLVKLLYEVNDEITKFLFLRNPKNKDFQRYRNDFEKDKFMVGEMIAILGEAEKICSVRFVTEIFEEYLRKDIRNMVFHKSYKIENGKIIENNLSKSSEELIVLTQKEIYDEVIKIITVFNCFYLNLYHLYLPNIMGSMDKLRAFGELSKDMNLD